MKADLKDCYWSAEWRGRRNKHVIFKMRI